MQERHALRFSERRFDCRQEIVQGNMPGLLQPGPR